MWEWLKTVSLLKSEKIKEKTSPKKLRTTKKNCKKVNNKILLLKFFKTFNSLIEKKNIKKEQQSPKIKEYVPTKLAKIYFSSNAALTSGGI